MPELKVQQQPEMRIPYFHAFDMLSPQPLDHLRIEEAAIPSPRIKQHFKGKVFQLTSEPWVKWHREAMLWPG